MEEIKKYKMEENFKGIYGGRIDLVREKNWRIRLNCIYIRKY